jgi:hypothetical protein
MKQKYIENELRILKDDLKEKFARIDHDYRYLQNKIAELTPIKSKPLFVRVLNPIIDFGFVLGVLAWGLGYLSWRMPVATLILALLILISDKAKKEGF